jgi:tryptophanyl-tRNA synthetase
METVVSGIRSTGNLHLGNYFGALRNFIKMQNEHHCYFFIADYHALTTHPNPAELHKNARAALIEYLACGINPDVATIYLQSDLPQIPELYLLLNMFAYTGELEKCTSFKDKIRQHSDNVNAGLLTYPVLMTADIIIHKATKVPVGKDQEQHLEMARNFANRFNHYYGTVFPEPYAYNFGNDLVKVPGLDGKGKMGKSEGAANAIYLIDDDATILKKVKKAVTDLAPTQPNQPMPDAIANLFALLQLVGEKAIYDQFFAAYNDCSIRYGDLKMQLATDMIAFVTPIRERIKILEADDKYIKKVVQEGGEKARISAQKTLHEVRNLMGLKGF